MKTFKIKYGDQESTFRASQVTEANLRSGLFQVDGTTITLLSEPDGICEVSNGQQFSLQEYDDGTRFVLRSIRNVQPLGMPIPSSSLFTPPTALTPSPAISHHNNTQLLTQQFSSPASRPVAQRRRAQANVKIVRADIGPSFKPTNQHTYNLSTHIALYSDDDANLTHITREVRMNMGEDDLVSVSGNGMRYYDEEGTGGLAFWKCGSRKYYAVPEEALTATAEDGGTNDGEQSEEERDFEMPKRKRRKSKPSGSDTILLSLKNIEESTKKILETSRRHNFNIGFLNALGEAFTCCICRICPSKPPLIACRACSTLLGCQTCIDGYFSGSALKSCPKCREPRGISNTFVLKGFDDLVGHASRLLDSDSSSESKNEG